MTRLKDKKTTSRHEKDEELVRPLRNESSRLLYRYKEENSTGNTVSENLRDDIELPSN